MSSLFNIDPQAGGNFHFERKLQSLGFTCVAGTDEVGRGPLAGPVVAACVSLPQACTPSSFIDSKKTTPRQRRELLKLIHKIGGVIGLGVVSHKRIDTLNILQASLLAMKLAVHHHAAIGEIPDFLLVDGKFEVPLHISQQALIKGESKSASIAAASIVAKVFRDALMEQLHHKYPHYGFHLHKGYATKIHRQAIARYGPCPIHRFSFKGVREFVL